MSDEEKELINNIERALNLSEVKGDLVTIIYNYIVKATINLINKLQKELDKKDKVIDLIITDYLNLSKERISKEEFKKWYFDLVGIKKVEEEK